MGLIAELAIKEGKPLKINRDRILVTEDTVRGLRGNRNFSKKLIRKAEKAAPYVCVFVGDTVVTMFRADQRLNRRFAR